MEVQIKFIYFSKHFIGPILFSDKVFKLNEKNKN